MNKTVKTLLGASALMLAAHASAQVTFYEGENFRGRALTTNKLIMNMENSGFNNRVSSLIVEVGTWEVCDGVRFSGKCAVLRKGSYQNLAGLRLGNQISSIRRVDDRRRYDNEPQPFAGPIYQWRQRPGERLLEAPVTSVRAVVGPPEQRCWVERQQVAGGEQRDVNIPGAIIGGVLGGILGHQIGGGTGKDVATGVGVIGGAAVGANVGRNNNSYTRDVRRCATAPSGPPQYYDVTYRYQGRDHQVQMSTPPGATVRVNRNGEPRL
ncbi:MAG: beta/gamma crystallin-related protein [Caldimonas sp.]